MFPFFKKEIASLVNVNSRRISERGNVIFIILLAVVLIGALTVAIQRTGRPDGANIDKETLFIRVSEVQRYASELERAISFILVQNSKSESDIRFSHPNAHADYGDLSADGDPTDQVFHRLGGAAYYRAPPNGINDGSAWEFYAGTDLPQVGSDLADLVAVLPNVTQEFCEKINEVNQQSGAQPIDTGGAAASGIDPGSCVGVGALGRFDAAQQFYTTVNTTNEATFTVFPALQACVQCSLDNNYYFYHVILAR